MVAISIIIPAYNRASVITKSIHSVQEQTCQDFELIIVNDGSRDNTKDTINTLKEKDSRITYFEHPQNLGAQAARNTGAKKAHGEWITFLDSDDQLLPKSLEMRIKVATQNNVKVVHSDCYVLRKDEELKLFGIPAIQGEVYKQVLTQPSTVFPSLLIAREALAKIGYLDETITSYQEWDTSIRLAKYYSFGFVSEPTFIYDCRGNDTISKNMLRDAEGYKQVFTKHQLEIIKFAGIKTLSQHYINLSYRYQRAGKKQEALLFKIIGYVGYPFRVKTVLKRILKLDVGKK
ncbi:MAG: glycosyltransferase family 2 protein [Gomphosphaeria aponina SAG 52.96 = DSM 107014]|uniref:Glycosyltransferase family 2 protein n=1 Tax=Gomphosphaeria aponina SAG 52.96 = DSM 107014 TaxID=1521640 RepID=A0A941JR79_9CHRO|nr:glycosyltransferase family 2 protein [Gomphosphaeria aponina SAG 52.96 = DSM 107014]